MTGRKFLLAVGVLLFGGWVEITNGGVSDGFITLAGLVLGIYSTSNVATKHVKTKAEKGL